MNRILVLNIGDVWHPNAKASAQDAARRWGAELCEVQSLLGAHHPYAAKFRLHQFATHGTQCLYLDADTVIRDDAPSPFELVPIGSWGAVRNHQPGMFENHERYQGESWANACGQLGVNLPYRNEHYINAGFIMFDWTHNAYMRTLERCVVNVQGVNEQAAWGVMMSQLPTIYLPAAWNRVGPAVWESRRDMSAYIYHFAVYLGYRHDAKADRIAHTQWRVHAQAPVNA